MANLDNFILFDVAEAIITDKATGEKFLNKFLTTSGITQSSNETEIRAGRGSGLIAMIESEKSLEVSLTNAVISKKWLEMQQGASFKEDENVTIVKSETVKVEVDDTDPLDIIRKGVLTGTPVASETTVTITNCEGDSEVVTLTGNEFIIPVGFKAEKDEEITALYKTEVTGEVLEIDSATFPKGWELQLEVPAMDKCTQAVTHKVVFLFDNVRPSSAFDMSFAMGEPIAPEMTVKIMKSCCNSGLGKMVIVPI